MIFSISKSLKHRSNIEPISPLTVIIFYNKYLCFAVKEPIQLLNIMYYTDHENITKICETMSRTFLSHWIYAYQESLNELDEPVGQYRPPPQEIYNESWQNKHIELYGPQNAKWWGIPLPLQLTSMYNIFPLALYVSISRLGQNTMHFSLSNVCIFPTPCPAELCHPTAYNRSVGCELA